MEERETDRSDPQGTVGEPFRDGCRRCGCGRVAVGSACDVGQGGETVCADGAGFSYTAAQTLWQALDTSWRTLRGELALAGVEWRTWSAADRVSATYVLLKRNLSGDALRDLYELVGDKDAVAAMDRETMGQPAQVEVTQPPVRSR